MNKIWEKRRKRIFEIIEVGTEYDYVSRAYDFFNAFCIILNLAVSMMYTFEDLRVQYGRIFITVEEITVFIFLIDYVLRIWTAKYLYPDYTQPQAVWKYIRSFTGIVDLLSYTIGAMGIKIRKAQNPAVINLHLVGRPGVEREIFDCLNIVYHNLLPPIFPIIL